MLLDIIHIAFLCVVIGAASIPVSFTVNSNPFVVWFGNALGSLFSAAVVIYIGKRITDKRFKERASKHRISKKVVKSFDEGTDSKKAQRASRIINKHGLRLFSLLCPIFPGVLVSTVIVFALNLDLKMYKRWMFAGVFFVSGGYVMGYWWIFVKT